MAFASKIGQIGMKLTNQQIQQFGEEGYEAAVQQAAAHPESQVPAQGATYPAGEWTKHSTSRGDAFNF